MTRKKSSTTSSFTFEKNVNDSYYTITTFDDQGKEVKLQALVFNKEMVQRDIENKEARSNNNELASE